MAITHFAGMDFLITGLSFLNAMLLLWLGFTVILNAQQRTWGIWLGGCGLLVGGLFFLLHSIVIGIYPDLFSIQKGWWWQIGWVLVVFLPAAWYLDILWYTGFSDPIENLSQSLWAAKKIHTYGIRALIAVISFNGVIFVITVPYSELRFTGGLNLFHMLTLQGTHIIIWMYALFILLCMGLSIYALRFPVPSGRLMGDEARTRALPYLSGATFSLFFVTILVIFTFGWIETELRAPGLWQTRILTIAILDISINTLILISVLLIGQAVIAYEVYTGETLPRKGLMRYWRRTILLGFGFSIFAGLSLVFYVQTIYILVLTAGLGISFFALMTWRLIGERESFMNQLRPFVRSEQIYEQVIQRETGQLAFSDAQSEKNLSSIFNHLCADILDTEYAILVPHANLLSFQDFALFYPQQKQPDLVLEKVLEAVSLNNDQNKLIEPVQIPEDARILWAISLWGDSGRVGVLFLGKKLDDSLYTQEEIEIARAACERLVDTQASIQMTKHLVTLQREQLVQNQLLDQRARQLLHDEILPEIHTVMLELNSQSNQPSNSQDGIHNLETIHKKLSDLLHNLPTTFSPKISRTQFLEAIKIIPELQTGGSFSEVKWKVVPEAVECIEKLPIHVREVLYFASREAIRNAAVHSMGSPNDPQNSLEIEISLPQGLEISIKNVGCGVNMEKMTHRMLDGGGKGLSIHHTMMAIIGGSLNLESVPDQFARVVLRIPLNAIDSFVQHKG
jgi:hypothetical protein